MPRSPSAHPDDALKHLAPDTLKPWPGNARTHSKKQVRQIADSIRTFGFTNPVLIDESNMILAGHGRVAAAKLLGLATVPCRLISTMTAAQKRAYVLADNKLALNAGWDEEMLAIELSGLLATELDFDLCVTGFSIPEIDSLIAGLDPEEPGDPRDDRLPEVAAGPAITAVGDVWHLGPHRVICGNALEAETYDRLLGDELAQMVFTDPPYNVPIDGNVCGSGRIRHREFAMAAGEMSQEEFTAFLGTAFGHLARRSADGAIHFVCMDWRHMAEILAAGQAHYTELKNLMVWVKDNGGMGTFYRSRHELVFAFKHGTAPHINAFELGQHGRYRTNVWEYRGVNSTRPGRLEELALHPTVKPVEMIADAIRDCSKRGGIILDPFGGSGSTLIAAAKTGRQARLAELDPVYVDRTVRRWQAWAKDDAVLADTGETFDVVALRRQTADEPERDRRGEPGMSSQPPAPPDDPEEEPSYEVGYGKPPQATRFQPGKSGNPKGRPKGEPESAAGRRRGGEAEGAGAAGGVPPDQDQGRRDAGGAADDTGGSCAASPSARPRETSGRSACSSTSWARSRANDAASARSSSRRRSLYKQRGEEQIADGALARLAGAGAGAASRPSHHRPDRRVGETARSVYARGKGGMGPAHRHEGRHSGSSSPSWRRSGGPHPAAAI